MPARYRQVQCPTLILWGENDQHFPPSQAQFLARQIPHVQLEILPDTPHWMVLTYPEAVVKRVRAFWNELAANA